MTEATNRKGGGPIPTTPASRGRRETARPLMGRGITRAYLFLRGVPGSILAAILVAPVAALVGIAAIFTGAAILIGGVE